MNSAIENRRHPRIPLSWPVILMTPQGPIKGETSNISVGGTLILCSETIEIDDEFQIILKHPEDHEMPVTCENVWSGKFISDETVYNVIGVRFIKISSSDREIIASMVAEYYLI